ncbi:MULTISPECIES: polysaccharide deacetylase family protein [Chryseobacterium]|uniref:Xylanase n=2 Tax=Chryseobacterium TaxID=59732 RepID=A0A3M7TFK6_9FLAO|nr:MULTISPECIES: polysaccharide deacetylase family protein [Chryseobacterium]RNA62295.1 xylanase [Chryseobacterium nematophagum]CAA7386042.1 Peptidoglycan-N-acetylmuramic acid deacetylase PdaC [Chryseobacterium fistulae]
MRYIFAEKSKNKTFLGIFTILCTASTLLNSCDQKSEWKPSEQIITQKDPIVEIPQKPEEEELPSDKRVIYLTFDDGPNQGTENLIKILNKRKVCATAFIVGRHRYGSLQQKDDFEKLKKDTLIELANHSFSHAHGKYVNFYSNSINVVHDFDRASDSLKLYNKIARTPGRNIWRLNNINFTDIKKSTKAADDLRKAGYKLVGWDLEWRPTNRMTLKGNHQVMLKKVDSIFFNDLEKTSKHLVLLTHDQYLTDPNSLNELEMFIEELQKSNRFIFKKISAYPRINEVLN